MISQAEKNGIKRILQDPNWNAVNHVIEELIRNIQDSHVAKDTEWDAAKGLIEKDAKVQSLRDLIAELFKQAA